MRALVIGGQARSLINFRGTLLRVLRDAGYEVHAAAAEWESAPETFARLRELDVEGHLVPIARTGLNPVSDLRTLTGLISLFRRIKPDVILTYTIKPVVWGTLAGWVCRVPRRYALVTGLGYAFTNSSGLKRGAVRLAARLLYRLSLAKAHGVFFQNPDDLALFRELGLISWDRPAYVVNGSGVDLSSYPQRPFSAGPMRFLMIARLLGDKGVREYAQAAAIVRRDCPEAEFHLVGGLDSNPDSIMKTEVESWVGDGDIIWHGAQADVRPHIARAHVFVHPSYREGTPRTVLEAMATGRPVITTDAPGCRETVVHEENGFLIPPKSVDALVSAIEQFIAEPDLISAMGARSLQIARKEYCDKKVAASMLKVIDGKESH